MVQSIEDVRRRPSGRVPPHNLEAEESLLGAMLLSRDAITAAVEARVEAHRLLQARARTSTTRSWRCYGQGEPVDPVTVAEELRRAELLDALGGSATLLRIQAATPASANAGHYASIVSELALLRRLIGVAGDIAEMGYEAPDDVDRDPRPRRVAGVRGRRAARRRLADRYLRRRSRATLDQLEALYGRDTDVTGVPTGYHDLDELLLGLQPSNLVIVAARPGQGKTSLRARRGRATSRSSAGSPVAVLLDGDGQPRAHEAPARGRSARRGPQAVDRQHPRARLAAAHHAVGRLAEAPLFIDDNPHCTVMEMRAKARRIKARHGDLGLIVVDYLQLMSTSATQRREPPGRGVGALARA